VVLHCGQLGEIYNVGSEVGTENIVLARAILDLLDKPHGLIQFVADRPGHDRRYSLNCAKMHRLGWQPRHTFEQALEKTVRWYVENEWWWRKIKSDEYMEHYRKRRGKMIESC